MAQEQTEIQFFDKFLFTKIFQSFRIAIHPSKMIIAFMAVAVISILGFVMDFSKPVVVTSDGSVTELDVYMLNRDAADEFIEMNKDSGARTGVYSTMWRFAAGEFQNSVDSVLDGRFRAVSQSIANYFMAAGWAFRYHFLYSIIFTSFKFVIICITGGAICRISALQFALGEKPGITEALKYSTRKFVSFLAAPLAPVAISMVLGFFILLLGLFAYIPYAGEILVAVFFIFALILGIVITIVLILTAAGFNLMFPALAYDGLDCFDAISRSFNYVYTRPWRMVAYTALAAVYGAICYMFVRFFAFLLLLVTRFSLGLGLFGKSAQKLEAIWPQPYFQNLSGILTTSELSGTEWISAIIINFFVLVILGLIVAFIMSFYFSANTIIYALLRKKVDNTDLDEVCQGVLPGNTEQVENPEQAGQSE
ncbi:MAG: hypothetical protein WC374_03100 [Phycisphaerae bacterium]|jgi:hypothetical protein